MSGEKRGPVRAGELIGLAMRRGGDAAEVFHTSSTSRKTHFRDREPEVEEVSENVGYALRVARGGRAGFAYLSSDDPAAAALAVDEALASADRGDEPAVPFGGAAGVMTVPPGIEDGGFMDRGGEGAADLLARAIEEAFAVSPLVRKIKRASVTEHFFREGLVTSEGFSGEKKGTVYSLSAAVMAGQGEDNEVGYEWFAARDFAGIAGSTAVADAARHAVGLLGGEPVRTGTYDVVLDPSVAASLVTVLGQALSGEAVAKGKSPLAGRLGEAVASARCTLVDDGLMPGGYASEPFDDEGVPKRRRTLIDAGVLRGWLLHRKSAAVLGLELTGNGGRADYKTLPSVRPANLHLVPGKCPPGDLIGGLSSGLLVVDILGAHTMDAVSGNISLGASGFVIEGGKTVRPFRRVTLAGNLYALLTRLAAVGDDLRFYGEVGSPSLLLEGVDVAGQD
jgi:PmbA protein